MKIKIAAIALAALYFIGMTVWNVTHPDPPRPDRGGIFTVSEYRIYRALRDTPEKDHPKLPITMGGSLHSMMFIAGQVEDNLRNGRRLTGIASHEIRYSYNWNGETE